MRPKPTQTVEFPQQIPVLVLAGGQGNGLFPLTLARPKPSLAFGPCRIVDFTLSNCRNSGFKNCVLLTQYRRDHIASHVRRNWNREFSCLSPAAGKRYRGTADAVYQNLLCLENAQHVLILAGDHIYQMDYQDMIQRHFDTRADLTLSTIQFPLNQASNFGVVEVNKDLKVCRFVEKPSAPRPIPDRPAAALISMGIYLFKVQALVEALHRHCYTGTGYDFGYHIVPSLIDSARVYAYDFCVEAGTPRYWRDVGTIDSYYNASMDFLQCPPPISVSGLPRDTACGPPTVSGTSHVSHSVLCDGVEVGDAVEIEDCVLMPRAKVSRGARLRRVIVDEGVQIPEGFNAGWDMEVDRLHHIVSPGGVVVVSHVPHPARIQIRRERSVTAGNRVPDVQVRSRREGI